MRNRRWRSPAPGRTATRDGPRRTIPRVRAPASRPASSGTSTSALRTGARRYLRARPAAMVSRSVLREAGERHESDLHSLDRLPHAGGAQHRELARPFVPVHRLEVLGIPGMASKLREAKGQRLQRLDERTRGDRLRPRFAVRRLPIEDAGVVDARVPLAQRHGEFAGQSAHDRSSGLTEVLMLVGIEVGGIPTHQLPESKELTPDLVVDSDRVVDGYHAVQRTPCAMLTDPLAQVDVKPRAEARPGPGIGRRLYCGGPPHHEADAGDDAPLVALDDSSIDARALTKVIGVDDEPALSHGRPLHRGAGSGLDRSGSRRGRLPGSLARRVRCRALDGFHGPLHSSEGSTSLPSG